MRNIFWAEISDLKSAKLASQTAGGFAWFMGGLTAVLVYLQTSGKVDLDGLVDASGYLDAGILFILGGGLLLRSRTAAVLAMAYVVFNRLAVMMESPGSGIFATVFQIAIFAGGIRGSFAYHEILKAEKKFNDGAPPAEIPASAEETPAANSKMQVFLKFMPIIAGILFVVGLGAVVMLLLQPSGPKSTVRVINPQNDSAPAIAADMPEKAPVPVAKMTETAPGERSFKLKTGETVSGRIVYDDPVYYTLENSGREFIVIKEDITQEINS